MSVMAFHNSAHMKKMSCHQTEKKKTAGANGSKVTSKLNLKKKYKDGQNISPSWNLGKIV